MTPLDLAVYAVVGIVLVFSVLAHSDPLTGRTLYSELKESWNQRKDE